MATIDDYLKQGAYPDQMIPENDTLAAAIPSGNPFEVKTSVLPTVTADKQASLVQTTDAKRMAMGAQPTDYEMAVGRLTGKGAQHMSDRESDIRQMSTVDLYLKYGPDAKQMISDRANAGTEAQVDLGNSSRSVPEALGDTGIAIGSGFANSIAGLANLGVGLISDKAGAAGAEMIKSANEWANEFKSGQMKASGKVQEAASTLTTRDNRVNEQVEIDKGVDELTAGFRRIGNDVIDSIKNAAISGDTLIDGTAQGVGSLLAAGPISKAIRVGGGLLIPEATKRGVGLAAAIDAAAGTQSAARVAAAVGESAPMLAAIGGMEAGGAYQQVTADVMGRSHETLMKESQTYRDLIEAGTDPQAAKEQVAKEQVANKTGLLSAAITAPLAAATGTLVSKFEGSPFSGKSIGHVVSNLLRETGEEAVQGGTSQLAQNFAEQQIANQDKDLADGVGRQVGEGALYGLGAAGVVQGPTVAKLAARQTLASVSVLGSAAMDLGGSALSARADALRKANEASAPNSPEAMSKAASESLATAEQAAPVVQEAIDSLDATPEQKAEVQNYADQMFKAAQFDPASVSESVSSIVEGSAHRVEAIQRLADAVESSPEGSPEQVQAGLNMYRLLEPFARLVEMDPEMLLAIPKDHQAASIIDQYNTLMDSVGTSEKVMNAIRMSHQALSQMQDRPVSDITEETLATPQGQQEVQDVMTIAEMAPDAANLNQVDQVLYQISQGKVQATPAQKAALETAGVLLRAAKAASEEQVRLGNDSRSAQVSREITSQDRGEGKSALEHAKSIVSAHKAGNLNLARSHLVRMGEFARHMQNKVGAINEHLNSGLGETGRVQFQALKFDPSNNKSVWFTTKGKAGMQVHPTSKGSVKFAQDVAMEAKLLTDVYNGLVTAFPDLKGQHVINTPLAEQLNYPAPQVVTEASAPVQSPAPVVEEPTLEPVTEPVVEAKDAPAKAYKPNYSKQVWNSVVVYDAFDGMKPGDWKVFENGFEDTRAFNYVTLSGVQIAGDFQLYGDQFLHFNISSKDGKASASPKVLKTILNNLQKDFPKVKRVHGFRISGVRANNPAVTEVKFSIKNGRWVMERPSTPTEPVKEVAATEEVLDGPVVEDKPAAPKLTGLRAVFTDLLNPETNRFYSSFELSEEPRTRLTGDETPLASITSALQDSHTLTQFIGKSLAHDFTEEIALEYQAFMRIGPQLVTAMNNNLQEYLSRNYSTKYKFTMLEMIQRNETVIQSDGTQLRGDQLQATVQGKALNLTIPQGDTLVFNPELVEMSALAGMQWLLTAENFGTDLDSKDIAEIAGVHQDAVTAEMERVLNEGIGSLEAKRTLASKIKSYWGLKEVADGEIGNQEGVAESMAAEILRVLVDHNGLTELSYYVQEGEIYQYTKGVDKVPSGAKTIDRLLTPDQVNKKADPMAQPLNPTLKLFPSAIEEAVMLVPEGINYIGDGHEIPVATKQLRQPLVDNTAQQLESIENEQATRYYVNSPMVGFYSALGPANILKLFAAGALDPENMNQNHAKSLDGKNRGVMSAFNHMMGVVGEVQNIAGKSGTELENIPIRYGFNVTRVQRLQMAGKFNPQASKLVREAILPTRSTLDLSSQSNQDYKRFVLGAAQLLGIKVHKFEYEQVQEDLHAMMQGGLAPSLATMRDWVAAHDVADTLNPADMLSDSVVDSLVQDFKAAKADLTPMGLHALMEYARYLNNPGKMTTSLYLEADGMTNGPFNAMMLFTTGPFTAQQLRIISKAGMYVNRPGMYSGKYNTEVDNQDVYQETTNALDKKLVDLKDYLATANPEASAQMKSLFTLMDEFLGKDFSIDQDGNLELSRGIAKNPLTITIYGSGETGIAAKMVRAITDGVYERLSEVLQGTNTFSPEVSKALNVLMYTSMFEDKKTGQLVVKAQEKKRKGDFDAKTFTFKTDELQNMTSTMKHLFVTPLRAAINETVGQSLTDTATLLRQATQAQSLVMEDAFKAQVNAELIKKAQNPEWRPSDFLTKAEMKAIYKKLDHLAPYVRTGTQTYFIAGSQSVDVGAAQFGSAFNGRFRTPAYVTGPSDSGVSGIPFMNIGAGDGQMMQNMSVSPNAPTGTLKIYDGINMPLDQIESGSLVANQAVFDSIQANPLKNVYESYAEFMKNADLDLMTEPLRKKLSESLFGLGNESGTTEEIKEAMQGLVSKLNRAQQEIEARHRVMAKIPLGLDQMASASTPYSREGEVTLEGTDNESLAIEMTKMLREELSKIRAEEKVTSSLGSELEALGDEQPSGAFILPAVALKMLTNTIKLPAGQAEVFKQLTNSLALKGYKVVYGDPNSITEESGRTHPQGTQGFTTVGNKTIYLVNPSSETLTHEMIHAATFETVLSYYSDPAFAKANPQGALAVKRIEALMDQFLNIELNQVSAELAQSYSDAVAAIETYSKGQKTAQNQASALNEFMAWSLSNESLISLGKRTRANKLAQITQSVLNFIKEMFFRRRPAVEKGTDMFSNLLFNSSMLMFSQPNLHTRMNASPLYMNSVYGQDVRLSELTQAYTNSIGRYLSTPLQMGRVLPDASVKTAIINGYTISQAVADAGFKMNMQEASLFHHMVAALSTEAKIDANAMAAANQMYTHVVKNLKVEDFMANPNSQDPAVHAMAQAKMAAIMGTGVVAADLHGRSTLMPTFLALATVNKEFRNILSRMDLPATEKNGARTVDAVLENFANAAMAKLSDRMAGTHKASNVLAAIDGLQAHVADLINERETFIDQVANKTGGIMDRANDIVVDGITTLSAAIVDKASAAQQNASNRLVKYSTGFAAGLAAVVNEQSGQRVSQGVMTALNRSNVWGPFHKLVSDVIGRTTSNANIYDMIKAVRSTVQQARQQFRDDVPGILASKFSRVLTKDEWASLHKSMGRTDLAALRSEFTRRDIESMLTDPRVLAAKIARLEGDIQQFDRNNFAARQAKGKQLATYMLTGYHGNNLLRNAETVAKLFGERHGRAFQTPDLTIIKKMDKLITMYALTQMEQGDKDLLSHLVQTEADGIDFALSYLVGQRKDELAKATSPAARLNHYKGHIPNKTLEGVSLLVAESREHAKLLAKSYKDVATYEGSRLDRSRGLRNYYFGKAAARAGYEQGIMQNVRQSVSGVDASTGYSNTITAGLIIDPNEVARIQANLANERNTNEPLLAVYGDDGKAVAFERTLSPELLERIQGEQDLSKSIGVWRGRQVEEAQSYTFNTALLDGLKAMYDNDILESASNEEQYVDIFASRDPVIADAAKLFNRETREYISEVFGESFKVRKDMLDDALGYRSASIGDAWTGTTRWSESTQKTVQNLAMSVMGNDAYKTLVNSEQVLKNLVSDARVLIVVKSVVVPVTNLISNMFQMIGRGIPLKSIVKGMPKKTAEVEGYVKARARHIEAEAELRAAGRNIRLRDSLTSEIQAIEDGYRRLTIWPLIEAGEFSSITDAGIGRDEIMLGEGRIQAYMEQLVSKLPGSISTLGRYAIITKDTALFQGLQKAVEYGDFLAKAILYDDLTQRKKLTHEQALGRVTEEFVNYDRLAGRFRGTLENLGLLWFYNFKIRSTKVALSMIRNNPVHTLLATLAPVPTLFGTVGLPTEDNMFSKLFNGTLDYSIGPGQGLRAPTLNPWHNLVQ